MMQLHRHANTFQVLRACLDVWKTSSAPPAERTVCYSWVEPKCRELFGTTFHQSVLEKLAESGHLSKADASRAGRRRYYKVNHPQMLEAICPRPAPNTGVC